MSFLVSDCNGNSEATKRAKLGETKGKQRIDRLDKLT